jgi:hypothetical protein
MIKVSDSFPIYFIICDVIFAILLLIIIDQFKRRAFIKEYKLTLEKRAALSEIDFCKQLSIDENKAKFVRSIRENLANRLSVNPNLIYPEDKPWRFDFGMVKAFDEPTKEYFYGNYEYFPENMKSVGDLVKFLIQVYADAKLESLK